MDCVGVPEGFFLFSWNLSGFTQQKGGTERAAFTPGREEVERASPLPLPLPRRRRRLLGG